MTTTQLNIYIIHVEAFQYRKNTCERLKTLLEKDGRFKLKFQYVTEFDPQTITQQDVRQFVNYEHIKDENLKAFNGAMKNLHVNHLSNALKHRRAIQLVAETTDEDVVSMILEDDIVFNDNIVDTLSSTIANRPTDYDMIFLGLPSSKTADGNAYQKLQDVFKFLPSCESYLITKAAAVKLFEHYTPLKFTNNIQLSYLIALQGLTAYLGIPNIFIDGSKLGLYYSSLEVNNRLIFNQEYVNLSKVILENNDFTDEQKQNINQQFLDVKLKTNPEFYYLKALYEQKIGNYVFAKGIFDYTHDLYEQNGTILNNQSTFLRDYMKIFKHLQSV